MLSSIAATAFAVALSTSSKLPDPDPDPLEDCYARIQLGVDDGHPCLIRATSETGRTAEAIVWLRTRTEQHANTAADRVTLGRLLARMHAPDASRELQLAIEAAARASDPYAEVMGRLSYARVLADDAALEQIDMQLDAARRVAHRQPDPFLSIEVGIATASIFHVLGARLGQAEATLREIEDLDGEPRAPAQAVRFHSVWAAIAVSTGRLETAVYRYRRAATLARENGELRTLARLRYNQAVSSHRLERQRGTLSGEYERPLEEVIATGLRIEDPQLVAMARALLGSTAPPERAKQVLEECLEATDVLPGYRTGCLRSLAWYRALDDLPAAEALIGEALTLSQQPAQRVELAESLSLWADVLWSRGDSLGAIVEGLTTIEVIETLRGMQDDAISRARLSAAWSYIYYETAGRALRVSEGSPKGAAFALGMMERLRARAIRDALAKDDAPAPAELPLPLRADETFFEDLQRRRTELRSRSKLGIAYLSCEETPAISSLQSHLRPDEALLSFQLDDLPIFETAPGRDGGGSWVIAITRETVTVHALAEGSNLDAMMEAYLGLFKGEASMLAPAGHALYQALLGDVVAALPEHVDRLSIIPDGRMHRLPFAALSTDPEGTPLVQQYGLSLAPSAELWLQWRKAGPVPVDRDAHLFADPPAPVTALASVFAAAPSVAALPLLPQARTEVQLIAEQLGARARIHEGLGASEAHLVDSTLDGGVLHLATHAVLDPDDPERSVLVLAADDRRDGLAHVREIASQPRPDAVVILAACRGADGLVLRGEGLLGLARGFLQAGARTVVASLWPLSDDEAAPFFAAFYGHLARGETTADALANTQRTWANAGRPPQTWAGLVVLGDGSAQPFSRSPSMPRWIGTLLLLAGVVVLGIGVVRRRAAG